MHLLAKLDKEAASEDTEDGGTEEVARTDALRRLLVEPKQEGEQQEVSNRFILLGGYLVWRSVKKKA